MIRAEIAKLTKLAQMNIPSKHDHYLDNTHSLHTHDKKTFCRKEAIEYKNPVGDREICVISIYVNYDMLFHWHH